MAQHVKRINDIQNHPEATSSFESDKNCIKKKRKKDSFHIQSNKLRPL